MKIIAKTQTSVEVQLSQDMDSDEVCNNLADMVGVGECGCCHYFCKYGEYKKNDIINVTKL